MGIYAPGGGPIPPGLIDKSSFKRVLDRALGKLLRLFHDASAVLASRTLTKQLLRLPHAALLDLLDSDDLLADSEDTVLTLLSWWLEGEVGQACSSQQVSELMKAVRYSRLSSTYLASALLLVPALQPTQSQMLELYEFQSLLHHPMPTYARLHRDAVLQQRPSSWFEPPRSPPAGGRTQRAVTLCLDISEAQLSNHLACARATDERGPAPETFSACVDFRGISVTLSVHSDRPDAQAAGGTRNHFFVTVGAHARLPGRHSKNVLQHGLPGRFSVNIAVNVRDTVVQLRQPSQLNRSGDGWNNFPQIATYLPGDPSHLSWWEPFILDGHVRITAEYTDERASNKVCIESETDSDDEDSYESDSNGHTSDQDEE
ncbi:MAG: hypothetical protein WDW38_009747 [Sanguina aurantia]